MARALREKNAETPGTDEYVIASGQHVWATTIQPEYEAYVSALETAESNYSSTITASRNTAALADASASITREGDIARAQQDRSLADVAATQADRDTSRTIQTDFLLGGGGITSQLSNDGSFRLNVAADTKSNALLVADAGQSVQSEVEPSAGGSTTEDPNNSESGPDFQASYDTHFGPLETQLETDIDARTTSWRTSTAASVESRTGRELNLSRDAQNAAAQRGKDYSEATADDDQTFRLAQLAEDVRHMGVVWDAEWTRSVTRGSR